MKRPLPMKIGADPEFTFNLGDSALNAQEVIKGLFGNPSLAKMGKEIGKHGIIGWDGASSTAEIRPSPSECPETVVNNIKELFMAAMKKNTLLSYKTMNLNAPIGGHIHFDTSILSKKFTDNFSNNLNKLHYLMTLYALPIFLGENQKHFVSRHMHSGYGKFNDYRSETHSGSKTYEFRLPSAEWITTPKIAQATLAYLGVVFAEIAKDPAKFYKANKDIAFTNEEQAKAIEQLFLADYKTLIRKHIFTVKRRIKTFDLYEDYKEEINYILNPKRIIKDKERVDYNACIGWDLKKKSHSLGKRAFLSPIKKNEKMFLKKMGDHSVKSKEIRENGDEATGYFALILRTAITKSITKIKNTYYIYGLRAGIPKHIIYNGKGKFLFGGDMIKTIKDAYEVSSVISRMSDNSKAAFEGPYRTLSEKKEPDKKNLILIGIPLEERKQLNTKNFLELIWKTERNLLPETEINITNLIDDTAEGATLGELAKVFLKEIPKKTS